MFNCALVVVQEKNESLRKRNMSFDGHYGFLKKVVHEKESFVFMFLLSLPRVTM